MPPHVLDSVYLVKTTRVRFVSRQLYPPTWLLFTRRAGGRDRVYKDECAYTFATPAHEGGLFVNLATWESVCADLLDLDRMKSSMTLYLWHRDVRVALPPSESEKPRPTELAIGTEQGFQTDDKKFR